MTQLISFYMQLLLRRSPVLISLVAVFALFGVAYALSLPNRYEASARLLVESPQIPDELAASTVQTTTAEQLQLISQRLMTRANLIDIANKFDVFAPGDGGDPLPPDQVVRNMRASTTIGQSVRRNAANHMDISFEADNPEAAAAVVNELVTRVLDDNVRIRTTRAGNTLEFFEQEVDRLSAELAQQSGRISEFKSKNSGSLPESLNLRLTREAALRERILGLEREFKSIEEQRERVTKAFEATGRIEAPEAQLTPEQRQLRSLETELASALAIYSETNPRVTVLRTRIEQLEKVVAGQSDVNSVSPTNSVYDLTVAEFDARAQTTRGQLEDANTELASLRQAIEQTPKTAIGLETLERDYRNIQGQYDSAIKRLSQAATGEQIELTAKGQRITVVENAIPPTHPTSPNRKVIAMAGGMAGVAAAAGLFALLELLNSTIRRPTDLVRSVGITAFATIPHIPTRGQILRRRLLQFLLLLVVFVVLPLGLYLIDQYVVSLGELAQIAKDAF